MCLGIFVLKTAENLEQLRLVSSIHNENNKNDKRALDIIISKKKKKNLTCVKLSATANTF